MSTCLKPLAALLPLLYLTPALSQQNLDPVVVTATRQATRVSETLADVTVLQREDIEKASGSSALELIARQPGIQLSNNGGLGKASSLFIRGAEARHTLLLIDGIPLGSATTGTPSLADIPLSQIERIEIVRGPSSAAYGSDAIGGVIGRGQMLSGNLRVSYLGTDGFNAAADPVRYKAVNGSFPNPDRDGYYQNSMSGSIAIRPAKGHELGITGYNVTGKNDYDGGGPTVFAYANVATTVLSAYSRNQWTDDWTSTVRFGQAEDSSTNFAPTRSLFETVQNQWMVENQIGLPLGSLLIGYEYLSQEVNSTTKYAVRERTVSSPFLGYNAKLGNHSVQLAGRRDDNSQFGAKNTGNLAYGYQFTSALSARGAIGTAFKAPTFNQLYFPGFGSTNLKPEEALNREIGLTWLETGHRIGWVYFDNKITDLIGGSPLVNINKATIRGNSLTYAGSIGHWQINASIDIMDPRDATTRKKLPRRADEQANFSLSYATGPLNVGTEVQAVGTRFDNATNTRRMKGYALVNLFGHYQITPDLRLEARINNLFDEQYETAWAYAQPRLSAFIGLRYNPK